MPATHIHDELHARCLVLDDGTTRLAFVVCDSLGIGREVFDQAREYIGKETDLPPRNVVMCATHTHSATPAGGSTPLGDGAVFEYRYLPTPAQHKLGGYETWLGTNRVEVLASRKITDQLLAMLADLAKNPRGPR